MVTPYAGVWIETRVAYHCRHARPVTPYAGVWIETCRKNKLVMILPVTPYAGVWIETFQLACATCIGKLRHPLRGGVD